MNVWAQSSNHLFSHLLVLHPGCHVLAWIWEYRGRQCWRQVRVNDICCSPLVHKFSHFIIEGNRVGLIWFSLGKSKCCSQPRSSHRQVWVELTQVIPALILIYCWLLSSSLTPAAEHGGLGDLVGEGWGKDITEFPQPYLYLLPPPVLLFCTAAQLQTLFIPAGVLVSLLVFLNISMDSLARVRGCFHRRDGFPKLLVFPRCCPWIPNYQLLDKPKSALLKPRVCPLALAFLSPPQDLQLHSRYSQACHRVSHPQPLLPCFWTTDPAVHNPGRPLQCLYQEAILGTLQKCSRLLASCPFALQQVLGKLKSLVKNRVCDPDTSLSCLKKLWGALSPSLPQSSWP